MNTDFSIIEISNTRLNQHLLYDLLIKMDEFYTPRISSRVNLEKYSLKLLQNGRVFCALNRRGRYVGLLGMYANDSANRKAFISNIGVLPEYHGKGVSNDLIMKSVEVAVKNGMKSISLEVSLHNHRAIAFYRKHGFHEEVRTVDALFMKKELTETEGFLHPLVSISCTTYNHAHYLCDALDGFLMQKTAFAVELLIHDDASIDGTVEIIKEYAEKYPYKIFPIYQAENQYSKGINISQTYQFSRAHGKYIALCEGDDYWTDPLKLQAQVDFLEANPDCTLCFHAVKILDDITGQITDVSRPPGVKQIYSIHDLLKPDAGNFIRLASVMLRADMVTKYPDWTVKHTVGDYPLYLLYAHLGNFGYLDKAMSVYRVSTSGVWSTKYKEPSYAERHVSSTIWMLNEFNKYTDYIYNDAIRIKIKRRWYNFIDMYTSQETRKVGKTFFWKYRKYLQLSQQADLFFKLYFPRLYQLNHRLKNSWIS